MRHWYRWETTENTRKSKLCTFLRRAKYRYESGGPAPLFVTFYVDDGELEDIRNWLRTH